MSHHDIFDVVVHFAAGCQLASWSLLLKPLPLKLAAIGLVLVAPLVWGHS